MNRSPLTGDDDLGTSVSGSGRAPPVWARRARLGLSGRAAALAGPLLCAAPSAGSGTVPIPGKSPDGGMVEVAAGGSGLRGEGGAGAGPGLGDGPGELGGGDGDKGAWAE